MVFQAEDSHLQRPVALKVLLPELLNRATDYRQRFLREARATAAINHPHVITIYQVAQDAEVPFFAMELLHGISLDEWMKGQPRIPPSDVLRIGWELASGLAAAHDKGLIHRDIKPSNIWLEGPQRRVKILDFGLARNERDDQHLTQTGTVLGTPSYMSPEQARSDKVDVRSDLFRLGCVSTGSPRVACTSRATRPTPC